MTDITKTAVLGTDDYHAFMRSVTIHGLQARGGYVAPVGTFADEIQGAAIQYEYVGHSAKDFHALVKFVAADGWIAGGSVLHFVHQEKVGYGDIDVFCVSQDAYNELRQCFIGYIDDLSSKRSCVAKTPLILVDDEQYQLTRNVNLVSPVDGQGWSHPANVLTEFDLSVAAVAIIEPGLAYTLHKDDVLEKRMSYIGNCRNPVKFWRRVMKYYNRGCTFAFDFFEKLIQDERTRELVYMAQDLYDMNSRKDNIAKDLLAACWAVNDYEGVYESNSDSVDDDYSEGWY